MKKPVVNIIHLPRREDRMLNIIRQAETQGFEYRLWEGIEQGNAMRDIGDSHKQIVQFAKENGMPEILIGEDDLMFVKPGEFDRFLAEKPAQYDLYLSGIYSGDVVNGRVKIFAGLHLYFINARYYDKFLTSRPEQHIDTGQANKGVFYVSQPFTCYQADGYSDQAKSKTDYNKKFNL